MWLANAKEGIMRRKELSRQFSPLATISMIAFIFFLLCIGSALAGSDSPVLKGGAPPGLSQSSVSQSPQPQIQELFGRLPLNFIENQGQAPEEVKFYTRDNRGSFYFTREGVLLALPQKASQATRADLKKAEEKPGPPAAGVKPASPAPIPESAAVRLTPLEMRPDVEIIPLEPQEMKVNYFIGNDPQKWHTNIPTFQAVLYREAYPGIDLKFYGTGKQLEYDVIVKPGADPARVKLRYQGVAGLRVNPQGDLVIALPGGGEMLQRKPVVYQEIGGLHVPREGSFHLARNAPGVFGFKVAAYDPRYPLVIDPRVVFSTYLGGEDYDSAFGIAVDYFGNIYVTGATGSLNFPTYRPSLQSSRRGDTDAFVTKIKVKPDGTYALDYSNYLGGRQGSQSGNGIAVDWYGHVYVTGSTTSRYFPVLRPLQAELAGSVNAFVTKIHFSGLSLIYSTYLGGNQRDFGNGIAVDRNGNVWVTGETDSDNFPCKNPLQATKRGSCDAFVTKIKADATLLYSSYLGGGNEDRGRAIALDRYGNAHVAGETLSDNFPILLPLPGHGSLSGSSDAFVTKIKADGSAYLYSTYLGGSNIDRAYAIAVGPDDWAWVTGETWSDDFPTQLPLQAENSGDINAFVTQIKSGGGFTSLLRSTYLGRTGIVRGRGIAVDPSYNVCVTGEARREDLPLWEGGLRGNVFVARFKGNAPMDPWYYYYLGGSKVEAGKAIAVDSYGNVYVAGETVSDDFPLRHPLQPLYGGKTDAFVVKMADR
jgi:hypothetical protein